MNAESIDVVQKLSTSEIFIGEINKQNTRIRGVFDLSFRELFNYPNGLDLIDILIEEPEDFLEVLRVQIAGYLEKPKDDVYVKIKDLNTNNIKSIHKTINELRNKEIDKLIVVDGIVKAKSDTRPEILWITYYCANCEKEKSALQRDGAIIKPNKCNCTRGKAIFHEVRRKRTDKLVLVIEESHVDSSGYDLKKIPILIRGLLAGPDFESRILRGDKVRIYGILKAKPKKQSKDNIVYSEEDLYILVNNIDLLESELDMIKINEADIDSIKEFAKKGNLLELFAKNLFSSVYGYDDVKKGIILQDIGCNKTVWGSKQIRGNSHILLMGDPSSAKSTFLTINHKLVPASRYACGKGATGVGLMGSVLRDDILNEWILEAGLFPLAHKSIVHFDELDKLNDHDKDALHEVMEQCSVSFDKANIHTRLIAETSLLAAANPKRGRFDQKGDFYSQFNLKPTLVNRFDLVFPFADKPEEKRDGKIADKIIQSHLGKKEEGIEVTPEFFKKYLVYCKRINPILTIESAELLKKKYIEIRKKAVIGKGMPITPRQIEAMIRFSKAHARLRLNERTDQEDVNIGVGLVLDSLKQCSVDLDTGEVDTDVLSTGVPQSKRSKMDLLLDAIDKLKSDKELSSTEEVLIKVEKTIPRLEAERLLEKLSNLGEIYEPKRGFLKMA